MHVFCGDGEARGEARPAVKRRSLSRSLLLLQDLKAQLFVRSDPPQAANNNPFPRQCLHMQTRVSPPQKRGKGNRLVSLAWVFFSSSIFVSGERNTSFFQLYPLLQQTAVSALAYVVYGWQATWILAVNTPGGGSDRPTGYQLFFLCAHAYVTFAHTKVQQTVRSPYLFPFRPAFDRG